VGLGCKWLGLGEGEGRYLLAGDEAEGFGGEGLGAAEGGFENAGEVGFQVALSGGVLALLSK